jgi:hypothetical protein
LVDCAAPQVLLLGHGLKVVGIDACPNAAEVVNLKSLWDRPHQCGVDNPVGVPHAIFIAAKSDPSVSAAALGAGEDQTSIA